MMKPFWESKTLDEMSDLEWEQICDGCGQCCLTKVIDDDTDDILYTNVACDLLDCHTARCTHYENRFQMEPDCIKLTRENMLSISWLPLTCSYRYVLEHQTLPEWHPLRVGDQSDMIRRHISVKNRVVHEKDIIAWEQHVIPINYFSDETN